MTCHRLTFAFLPLAAACGTAAAPDVTPPSFAGVAAARRVDWRTLEVTWSPASDDRTPPEAIRYRIAVNEVETDVPIGATRASVSVPDSWTGSWAVSVSALDAAGNVDGNTAVAWVEAVSGRVDPAGCVPFAVSALVPVDGGGFLAFGSHGMVVAIAADRSQRVLPSPTFVSFTDAAPWRGGAVALAENGRLWTFTPAGEATAFPAIAPSRGPIATAGERLFVGTAGAIYRSTGDAFVRVAGAACPAGEVTLEIAADDRELFLDCGPRVVAFAHEGGAERTVGRHDDQNVVLAPTGDGGVVVAGLSGVKLLAGGEATRLAGGYGTVATDGRGGVVAVTSEQTILHRAGETQLLAGGSSPRGPLGRSPSGATLQLGLLGTAWFDGERWTTEYTRCERPAGRPCAVPADGVRDVDATCTFALDWTGHVLQHADGAWAAVQGAEPRLRAIAAAGPGRAVAVGERGLVAFIAAGRIERTAVITNADLTHVAVDGDRIYAASTLTLHGIDAATSANLDGFPRRSFEEQIEALAVTSDGALFVQEGSQLWVWDGAALHRHVAIERIAAFGPGPNGSLHVVAGRGAVLELAARGDATPARP